MRRRTAAMPRAGQALVAAASLAWYAPVELLSDLYNRRNPLARYVGYGVNRGMSRWYDVVDWVGGYPYESASPDEIFDFCRSRGFTLDRLTTNGGDHGCNQFVF